MAYLPGPIEHDLFLSYASKDVKWVSAFQEQLTDRLSRRLGFDCKIWFDENELRTGHDVPEVLFKAIRVSAAFIAVLSRDYEGSTWCERELAAFLTGAGGLEMGGYQRLLKVIKFPWRDNAHLDFYPDYKDFPLFEVDPKTGQEEELRPNTDPFRDAVSKLSFHIEKLFEAMLYGIEKVFVARTAYDADDERKSLIREIRAAGYGLSPPPEGNIARGLDRSRLLVYLGEARVSVHVLGAAFDPAVRDQIDLARDAGRKIVFYLTRSQEPASGEQRRLIEDIRANRWSLAAGTWALLESRSAAAQRQDLIEFLRPPKPIAASTGNGAARVYLLCDPSSEDASFAREVQGKIREKEKFDVVLPQAAAASPSPGAEHERLLRSCDGLLLYRQCAPDAWYSRNFKDLITAEDRARDRELKSKALLVGRPNVAVPGLTVIQRQDPFGLDQLEPFLAPLRTGQGEAAHAGS